MIFDDQNVFYSQALTSNPINTGYSDPVGYICFNSLLRSELSRNILFQNNNF